MCRGVVLLSLLSLTLAGGCATGGSTVTTTDESARVFAAFQERVENYMELREKATEPVPALEPTEDAARISAYQDALATRIRVARTAARHGDIFTPEIRMHFRRLLAPELKGEDGRDIRATLQDDAPEPGAVPLEVNASYPSGTAFPTTPAPLLAALPRLPPRLEYRIIGRDLILLDQPANLIVDFVRNAIPARPPVAPRSR